MGVGILVLFVQAERRSDHPSIDVALFRNPSFSAAAIAVTAAFFALFGSTFFLTYYLQFDRMYTPLQAGVRLLPVALSVLVFAPRSSKLVARFGARVVCTGGLLLVTAAFATYQLLETNSSIWLLEGLLLLQGTGIANVIAPATDSILSTLPRDKSGAGSAVNNVTRQVGGALGVAILGSILSVTYSHGITARLHGTAPQVAAGVRKSIGAAVVIAQQQPAAQRAQILDAVRPAFIHAMHVTAIGSAAVALLGAVLTVIFLPGRKRLAAQAQRADEPREASAAAAG